jgi:tripartite-type tricarboxylate transporter receptor subunit TctC
VVALVASPRLGPAETAKLRGWLDGLVHDPDWRASQRRQGREAPRLGAGQLKRFLGEEVRRAERQERLSRSVEGG